ncbi:LysM peptidoglycan-binding domain-containing protein [Paenibacillus sp. SYP-B3998]|uniref:LysM peptidoglycan-binding domain-containing protein n=1 Tax=Paenibacillus sp. SYP-B3998 TaxID=2678564 RepID=A0A6G3ZQX0_9BACL|nr:LysM peptidoglycan-binding domain-containing protein [Paenibacillus sp. SYP-B3998]NEW04515.1 LysM peptidoglycan-binding domain-containing protein [Paenibacillus sp. SYP-B3998]
MKIHIVKKGDSLNELAKKHHVELDQIIAFNPQITDPNHLSIGEKVKIPSHPKPVELPASEYVYKHIVQQGDSLWKLGKAWDVSLQAMIQANPQLKNPNVLMTGEVVYVPKAPDGHSNGLEHGHDHVHMGHQPLPGHHHKTSTAPFVQPEVVQQGTPTEPAEPPFMPIVEGPISQVTPSPIESTAPSQEIPSVNAPAPVIPIPMIPLPEKEHNELNEPYTQPAVHPFQQFHITATEVFAYPSAEQAETVNYPEFAPYPQLPWEHEHYPAQTGQIPVSNGGCGCGETNYTEPSWKGFPTGGPIASPFSEEAPWQTYAQAAPPMPGFYPQTPLQMGSPYDMQQPPCYPLGPEFYAPQHGTLPHYGMPFPTPYESPILPQVHAHQLAEETDKEETVEIDIRSDKKSGKTTKANTNPAKKARQSGSSNISALSRRQQASEKQEPKANVPWINV